MGYRLGLVLEGGGLRGTYTIGVLDELMRQEIWADYVIGVSAGACHGSSYVSRQIGRAYRVNVGYVRDPRYLSVGNFLRTRSLFGMDFLFREIPTTLEPFDDAAFQASPSAFVAGVTDLRTGEPVYFGKRPFDEQMRVLAASSSIPVFSPPVEIGGGLYLDGGTSDPIPVGKALEDGCERVIVVRTRHRDYVKPPEGFRAVYRRTLRDYPEMIALLDRRHEIYRRTVARIDQLEREGRALVIAPERPLQVGRFERDVSKLEALARLGEEDVRRQLAAIRAFAGEGSR